MAKWETIRDKIKKADSPKEIKKYQKMLDKLGDDRGIWITCDLHGNSIAAAGHRLHMYPEDVKKRLAFARNALESAYKPEAKPKADE